MTDEPNLPMPSLETRYAGQLLANEVLFKLLISITTHLVHTAPEEREAESADLVRDALAGFAQSMLIDAGGLTEDVGVYDPEIAHQIALDALDEAATKIRTRVLGMRE